MTVLFNFNYFYPLCCPNNIYSYAVSIWIIWKERVDALKVPRGRRRPDIDEHVKTQKKKSTDKHTLFIFVNTSSPLSDGKDTPINNKERHKTSQLMGSKGEKTSSRPFQFGGLRETQRGLGLHPHYAVQIMRNTKMHSTFVTEKEDALCDCTIWFWDRGWRCCRTQLFKSAFMIVSPEFQFPENDFWWMKKRGGGRNKSRQSLVLSVHRRPILHQCLYCRVWTQN